jgi:hypothetical protein
MRSSTLSGDGGGWSIAIARKCERRVAAEGNFGPVRVPGNPDRSLGSLLSSLFGCQAAGSSGTWIQPVLSMFSFSPTTPIQHSEKAVGITEDDWFFDQFDQGQQPQTRHAVFVLKKSRRHPHQNDSWRGTRRTVRVDRRLGSHHG